MEMTDLRTYRCKGCGETTNTGLTYLRRQTCPCAGKECVLKQRRNALDGRKQDGPQTVSQVIRVPQSETSNEAAIRQQKESAILRDTQNDTPTIKGRHSHGGRAVPDSASAEQRALARFSSNEGTPPEGVSRLYRPARPDSGSSTQEGLLTSDISRKTHARLLLALRHS